jgi:uncharacterized membrane protein
MTQLVLALAVLFLSHYGISSTGIRDAMVARLGEIPYRIVYSLIAVLAFVWLVVAWRNAPYVMLWPPFQALHVVTHLCMLLAALLLIGGLSTPNPTAMDQIKALDRPEPAKGVIRITRHPVRWASGLWGIGHLVARGDLAAVLFFGGIAALALVGTHLLDRKYERRAGDPFRRFESITSVLPFGAILGGRQRLVLAEIGPVRLGGALLLYALLLAAHPWLFGAQPQPEWMRISAL